MANADSKYSMYGHVRTLAEAEKAGIEKAGGTADLFRYASSPLKQPCYTNKANNDSSIPETLSDEVLGKMHVRPAPSHSPLIPPNPPPSRPHAPLTPNPSLSPQAPAKDQDIPELHDPTTLESYDAFLFGIPTRYGNFPAQWKTFWDKTGKQWAQGSYYGKYAGIFVSTSTPGGGQESTVISAMSTLAHHGIIYVPLGYKTSFALLSDLSEVRGGSPWGAGTFAGGDGSRQPTGKELELATTQGSSFYEHVKKVSF